MSNIFFPGQRRLLLDGELYFAWFVQHKVKMWFIESKELMHRPHEAAGIKDFLVPKKKKIQYPYIIQIERLNSRELAVAGASGDH